MFLISGCFVNCDVLPESDCLRLKAQSLCEDDMVNSNLCRDFCKGGILGHTKWTELCETNELFATL